MPPRSPAPYPDSRLRRASREARPTLALFALAFACLGLTACSGSSGGPPQARGPSPQEVETYKRQRAELVELVSCARRHGINLPPPTANNKISTRGVNLKSPRRKAAINACYQKVVQKASAEERERAEQSSPPPRLGEEPSPREAQTAPSGAAAFAQERRRLMEVVSCARKHGVHLPEPDAHNNIKTRGLHLEHGHNKTVMNICFHQVVSKAEAQGGQ